MANRGAGKSFSTLMWQCIKREPQLINKEANYTPTLSRLELISVRFFHPKESFFYFLRRLCFGLFKEFQLSFRPKLSHLLNDHLSIKSTLMINESIYS